MVLKQHRIFTAMLGLGEFTTRELAAASGVSEPTIRTTVGRYEALFEDRGVRPTGRRGGAPRVRRLKPEGAAWLRERIGGGRNTDVPRALIAAEELLNEIQTSTDVEAQEDLLLRAAALIRDAEQEGGADDRRMGVSWLMKLAQAELDGMAVSWGLLMDELRRLSDQLEGIDGGAFRAALLRRGLRSPLADRSAAEIAESVYFGEFSEFICASLLDLVPTVAATISPQVGASPLDVLVGVLQHCAHQDLAVSVELSPGEDLQRDLQPCDGRRSTNLAVPGFRLEVCVRPQEAQSDEEFVHRRLPLEVGFNEVDILWVPSGREEQGLAVPMRKKVGARYGMGLLPEVLDSSARLHQNEEIETSLPPLPTAGRISSRSNERV